MQFAHELQNRPSCQKSKHQQNAFCFPPSSNTPQRLWAKRGPLLFLFLNQVANTPFKPEKDNKKIWFQGKSLACLNVLQLKDSQQSRSRPPQRTKVNTDLVSSWLLGRWLWNPRSQLKLGKAARRRLWGNWRQSTTPSRTPQSWHRRTRAHICCQIWFHKKFQETGCCFFFFLLFKELSWLLSFWQLVCSLFYPQRLPVLGM